MKNISNTIDISKESKLFTKAVENVIEKGAGYIVRALPIQENVKDVLIDVTGVLKTRSFSKIVQTAVTSSIREGAEFLSTPLAVIKDIKKVTEMAKKGGLREGLCSAIDITFDKYIKNNLISDVIKNYKDEIKRFINSKEFDRQLTLNIEKIASKQDNIKTLIEDWKVNYRKLDISGLNNKIQELTKLNPYIAKMPHYKQEFKYIRNITDFVNSNKTQLTQKQLEFCKNL